MDEREKNVKRHGIRWILLVVLVIILLLLISCCGGIGGDVRPEQTTAPVQQETAISVEITQPVVETTAPTEPVETIPPATEASATEPTTTTPAATEVHATEPPATEPPKSEHTHSYSSKGTAPSCTETGYTTYTCACGYSYTETLKATGHSWTDWTEIDPPTVDKEGTATRSCKICGATESQSIEKLVAETNPPTEAPTQEPAETIPPQTEPPTTEQPPAEPAGCEHSWEMNYHPEEGHYGEQYYQCRCGARFSSPDEVFAHMESVSPAEFVQHSSWNDGQDWIVDSPEYYEWICSKCGASTTTQP